MHTSYVSVYVRRSSRATTFERWTLFYGLCRNLSYPTFRVLLEVCPAAWTVTSRSYSEALTLRGMQALLTPPAQKAATGRVTGSGRQDPHFSTGRLPIIMLLQAATCSALCAASGRLTSRKRIQDTDRALLRKFFLTRTRPSSRTERALA